MKSEVMSRQRLETRIMVHIDGSAVGGGTLTTNGVLRGYEHVKVTENGSGDYTITLNEAGAQACMAIATPITALSNVEIAAATASTVQVLQRTATTAAALADADFYVEIFVYGSADEY
jgi:hypothetical protein